MPRFGTTPGRPLEMRKLSLDTAEILLNWDKKYVSSAMVIEGEDKLTSEKLTPQAIEAICVFLINMVFTTCLGTPNSDDILLCKRALKLFKESLSFWKSGFVKFISLQNAFTKIFVPNNNLTPAQQEILWYQLLELVNTMIQNEELTTESSAVFAANLYGVKITFTKNWRYCNNTTIRNLYCQSYSKLLTMFPITKQIGLLPEIKDLYTNFRDYLVTGLQGTTPDRSNVHIGVSFLECLINADPMYLDRDPDLVGHLCLAFQKLCNESIAYQKKYKESCARIPGLTQQISFASNQKHLSEMQHNLEVETKNKQQIKQLQSLVSESLIKMNRIMSDRVHLFVADRKKQYFSSFMNLLDKSLDIKLLYELAFCIHHWVVNDSKTPSIPFKIKSSLLIRLSRTERQLPLEIASIHLQEKGNVNLSNSQIASNLPSILNASLMTSLNDINLLYLETLLILFSNAIVMEPRPDGFNRISRCFFVGLRSKNTSIVRRYLNALNNGHYSKYIVSRLEHLLTNVDWESISETYYITHIVDLLLSSSVPSQKLAPIEGTSRIAAVPFIICPNSNSNPNLQKHFNNVCEMRKILNVGTFVETIRGLLYVAPPRFAHIIFIQLFSSLWPNLPIENHVTLQTALITFLSRNWHNKQTFLSLDQTSTTYHTTLSYNDLRMTNSINSNISNFNPYLPCNVIQTIIESISQSAPAPYLPPLLLQYVGKTYNCWHSSLSLLESRLASSKNDVATMDGIIIFIQVLYY